MLFLYRNSPPPPPLGKIAPPHPNPLEPPPPPPTATTETLVTPAGATQENVPEDVNACCPVTAVVVIELLAALAALVPAEFVAVTVNV
jgi:hypothetical protein